MLCKPWGRVDPRPWFAGDTGRLRIGEARLRRTTEGAAEPALLFTDAPLSIQVHPDDDDDYARSVGLPQGKTEAWYVLDAVPGAKGALGLKQRMDAAALRQAIASGAIADLADWREVHPGDVVFVPAGTIHAIGAGLVIAEIQQNSDVTFPLFDYGRNRELHIDAAVSVARAGPAAAQPVSRRPPVSRRSPVSRKLPVPRKLPVSRRFPDARWLLMARPYFILERIDLPACSQCDIHAASDTWILALSGDARVNAIDLIMGSGIFMAADRATIKAGPEEIRCLVAFAGHAVKRNLVCPMGVRS